MSRILNDLQEIPQDWFNELSREDEPKKSELESIDFDLYQSECPELLGNMELELFLGKDGFYYMLMNIQEPIGDYGSHWIERWHKCEEQHIEKINEILHKEDTKNANPAN